MLQDKPVRAYVFCHLLNGWFFFLTSGGYKYKEETFILRIQCSDLLLMQRNYCSACSTEWNKLKKRQSCVTERKGFSESRNTDLVHVALFVLIRYYLLCYYYVCLCQVPEEACVCLYVLSQKYKHLDLLWFAC